MLHFTDRSALVLRVILLLSFVSLSACSSSGSDSTVGDTDSSGATTGTDANGTDANGTDANGTDTGGADSGGTGTDTDTGGSDTGGTDTSGAGADSDGTTETGAGEGSGESTAGSNIPAVGSYDLSEYLFHRNVLTDGGQVSFLEKAYAKTVEDSESFLEGEGFIGLDRSFVNNGGIIEESSSGSLDKKFTITASTIDESLISTDDFRQAKRFASIGEQYMNADSKPIALGSGPALQQNATCVVQEHLENFNLTTATGDRALASGVYEDVLKVECVTGYIANGAVQPHTILRSYHAKDIGVVFAEGTVFFLGDVYIIEEY